MELLEKINRRKRKSEATVVGVQRLPGFIRIVAQTECEDVLTREAVGGYIKFVVDEDKKVMRSISVAQNSKESFTLDFVDHGANGPAAIFARESKVGDKFSFFGPGPTSKINYECDQYLFFGDLAAFPPMKASILKVIASNPNAKIHVYGKCDHETFQAYFNELADKVDLKSGDLNLGYLSLYEGLSDRVGDNTFLWAAGEKTEVQKLRKQASLPKNSYVSSYWEK